MLVQFFREQPGDDVEVFVVVRGEPARVGLRSFQRTTRRRRVRGDFEFVWAQHWFLLQRETPSSSHNWPAGCKTLISFRPPEKPRAPQANTGPLCTPHSDA